MCRFGGALARYRAPMVRSCSPRKEGRYGVVLLIVISLIEELSHESYQYRFRGDAVDPDL